jgi:hypothetical protein
MVWSKYRWHESFWGVELQSQHLACYSMFLQPSSLVVHEVEVHYDATAHPRSYWVFRILSVDESRRPRQISHELLLSVSCSIHCL